MSTLAHGTFFVCDHDEAIYQPTGNSRKLLLFISLKVHKFLYLGQHLTFQFDIKATRTQAVSTDLEFSPQT